MPARFSSFRSLLLWLCLCTSALAAKFTWDPVSPDDLAPPPAATPHDAEFLFSRHDYKGNDQGSEFTHYLRVKVLTPKGTDANRKMEIELDTDEKLTHVLARVIHVNGSIHELAEGDFIHSREKKRNTDKEGRVTFSLPDLAPGDLVEYYWRTTRNRDVYSMVVPVQQAYPIRHYEHRFSSGFRNHLIFWSNTNNAKSEIKNRAVLVTINDVPAFIPEPLMPAHSDFSTWLGMVPIPDATNGREMWDDLCERLADEIKDATRSNKLIRETAAAIVGDTTDPMEKLRKLYEFCQTEIQNLTWNSSDAISKLRADREKEDPYEKEPKDILKRKAGYQNEIRMLFAALTASVGLKPEHVAFAHATTLRNIRNTHGWSFLDKRTLAFRINDQIFFCSPEDPYLPFGGRSWQDELSSAVIATPKAPGFVTLPLSSPEENRIDEQVKARVDAEGTLEGTVTITYTGMKAWDLKSDRWWMDPEAFDRRVAEELQEQLPHAEVTDIVWTHLRTRELPLVLTYKLRVPNYAEALGSRLSMPLNPLRVGTKNPLADSKRKYPVMFKHTFHTTMTIELEYPEGFAPESPSQPQSYGNEKSAIAITYNVWLQPKRRTLIYKRDYVLGRGPGKEFSPEAYDAFRQVFSLLEKGDNHTILLKPVEPAPESATPATTATP
ncbi:DUF3857 domain-containing protein [Nibricoccus sp. IMCC34717]|uniref:DUF3857 domain-containing protein n=1 Tax=Nibricoccus sp. IMCC34717 TaxID=3034021 RepID=UPI00384ED507